MRPPFYLWRVREVKIAEEQAYELEISRIKTIDAVLAYGTREACRAAYRLLGDRLPRPDASHQHRG